MFTHKILSISRSTHRIFLSKSLNNPFPRFYSTEIKSSNSKLILIGVGAGGVMGTAYSIFTIYNRSNGEYITEQTMPLIIDKLPDVKIARKIVNRTAESNLDLVLFQYQTCPFCCKVRAYLDSQGFSYSVVEVDPVLRQSLKWSTYNKVPILLARCKNGKYIRLVDSSMIVSTLATFLVNTDQDILEVAKLYPNVPYVDHDGNNKNDVLNKYFLMYQDNANIPKHITNVNIEEERKWRSWADNHLVHLISPNVYRSIAESLRTFEWFSEIGEWDTLFPKWERHLMVYVGAMAMWTISKRLKSRHGLTDDVREHLYSACQQWTANIDNKKTKFHGGKLPNLADLTVFGVLSSMEGCQAFSDCLQNTNIGPWFYAMKDYIQQSRGYIVKQTNF